MSKGRSDRNQFFIAVGVSTLVSLGLFSYAALRNSSLAFGFMTWNLLLAWVPLLLALRLNTVLNKKLWSSWEALATSILWIVFLPNSFYMITDYVHLQEVARVDLLFDVVMFTSFVFTGVLLGFASLYLIHLQLRKRFSERAAAAWVGIVLFICSGAIYVGRDLRWNSWDVLFNPGGLLFDLSDRLQHPSDYPQMVVTVIGFFALLATMYYVLWSTSKQLKSDS